MRPASAWRWPATGAVRLAKVPTTLPNQAGGIEIKTNESKRGKNSDQNPHANPEAKVNPKLFPPLIAYMVKQGVFVNPTMMQWSSCTERWRDRVAVAQQLVKKAGACTACPKRTGAEPALFEDIKIGRAHV